MEEMVQQVAAEYGHATSVTPDGREILYETRFRLRRRDADYDLWMGESVRVRAVSVPDAERLLRRHARRLLRIRAQRESKRQASDARNG